MQQEIYNKKMKNFIEYDNLELDGETNATHKESAHP